MEGNRTTTTKLLSSHLRVFFVKLHLKNITNLCKAFSTDNLVGITKCNSHFIYDTLSRHGKIYLLSNFQEALFISCLRS